MAGFTRRGLKALVDGERIRTAIQAAESDTSGEIRVSLAPYFWGNVRKTAAVAFDRLGMAATRERNGVLLFVVPSRRRFVILGDAGIHDRVGQVFWDTLAADLARRCADGDLSEALLAGITAIGRELAAYFPRRDTDRNELRDDVDLGPAR